MKKETIIWQFVILALGLTLIFNIQSYLQNKLEVETEAKRAECIINATSKNLDADVKKFCMDIDTMRNF